MFGLFILAGAKGRHHAARLDYRHNTYPLKNRYGDGGLATKNSGFYSFDKLFLCIRIKLKARKQAAIGAFDGPEMQGLWVVTGNFPVLGRARFTSPKR